jgi:hypothetical protein
LHFNSQPPCNPQHPFWFPHELPRYKDHIRNRLIPIQHISRLLCLFSLTELVEVFRPFAFIASLDNVACALCLLDHAYGTDEEGWLYARGLYFFADAASDLDLVVRTHNTTLLFVVGA